MAHLLASEHLVRGLLMKINTQPTLHADAVLCFLQYLSADKEDLCTNHCLFFFCFILPLQSNRLSWSHPMLNLPLKRMLFNTHKHTYAHTIGHSHTHRHTHTQKHTTQPCYRIDCSIVQHVLVDPAALCCRGLGFVVLFMLNVNTDFFNSLL